MKCKLCHSNTKQKYVLSGVRSGRDVALCYCMRCNFRYCVTDEYDYTDGDENIIGYYQNAKDYIEHRQQKIFGNVEEAFEMHSKVFLDIGSGIGYSLAVADAFGWKTLGVEPSIALSRYSKEVLGHNTFTGYLSSNTINSIRTFLPSGYADYVLIDNVLEHVPEPLEFFRNALSLVRPGGLLLVIVPPVDWLRLGLASISYIREHIASAQINLFYDPEQHINYFSRKAMYVLAEKVGGCRLISHSFHHSWLLNGWIARMLEFETGYYFILKDTL